MVVGAGIGRGVDTKGVGLMGGDERTCRVRKLRLEKLRARKETGRISTYIEQKVKELVRRQVTKESGWTKGVGKAIGPGKCACGAGREKRCMERHGRGRRR